MAKSYKFIGGEWDGRYCEFNDAPPEYRVFARSRMPRLNLFASQTVPPESPDIPIDEYVKARITQGQTVYILKQACT